MRQKRYQNWNKGRFLAALAAAVGIVILLFLGAAGIRLSTGQLPDQLITHLKGAYVVQASWKACYQVVQEVVLNPTLYVLTLGILAVEYWKPAKKKQKLLSAGFFQDLLWLMGDFFIAGLLLVPFTTLLRSGYARIFQPLSIDLPGHFHLPEMVTLAIAILGVDFLSWAAHRLQHRYLFLWRFHAVHHSQAEMNLFTDARFHFGDALVSYPLQLIPLYLFLIPFPHGIYYVFFRVWYPRFYHANLGINLGPLKYILVTPQSHRIHHSTEKKHWDKNFGVIFSFWDYLFGTQYKNYREYPNTGIDDECFPVATHLRFWHLPCNYLQQMIHPFRSIKGNTH